MPTRSRVEPWLTLSVAQGNAVQVGGMLGAATLAWPRRSTRDRRRTPDGLEQLAGVFFGARLLPPARRAGPGHPLHRVWPPRHEPPAVLPTGGASCSHASPS